MIRTWSYLQEYDTERDEILESVDRVFRSGQLILGENVRAFEHEFSGYSGARAGVGVANATDGLFLALKSLNIGVGDEVVTVANTAVPTVAAIVATGATPVFVDIDARTYLMDVNRLPDAITARTRAIIPVHLYGQCVDMEMVGELATRRGVAVIEDCAQAHGASRNGKRAGSFGDLSVFSFYPTKPLGAYGDGGIVLTSRSDLEARLRRLRCYGMDEDYVALEDGYNSRLDEVQAAILRVKLGRLDSYLAARQSIALRYAEQLKDSDACLPVVDRGNVHAFHLYVVRHPERMRIMGELATSDIVLSIHYPVPIHLMPAYQRLGSEKGRLPVTERA